MTVAPGKPRQIVAFGGGGLGTEPENRLLDDYMLGLTHKSQPKICFLPTAKGDADESLLRFYKTYADARCQATHLALFRRTVDDLRSFLLEQDVIYVGGGNTANMLAIWRVHGVDRILREAWKAGIVLSGVSAGALCWFNGGVTDSFGPNLAALPDGLGFLPGSHCPHYDNEPRRPDYHRFVAAGALVSGLAADDGCGLHFEGTALKAVVTSRPNARAYRVVRDDAGGSDGSGVTETPLEARLLG